MSHFNMHNHFLETFHQYTHTQNMLGQWHITKRIPLARMQRPVSSSMPTLTKGFTIFWSFPITSPSSTYLHLYTPYIPTCTYIHVSYVIIHIRNWAPMYQSHYIGITSLKMVSKPCPLGFYRSLVAPPPPPPPPPQNTEIFCVLYTAHAPALRVIYPQMML